MEAIQEIDGHTYLLDGSKLLAYIRQGETIADYFDQPLRFDRRRRNFQRVSTDLFKKPIQDTRITVQGSRGNIYYVDAQAQTCTCPGYTFQGNCKHIKTLTEAA
jgi:hypothetical protein